MSPQPTPQAATPPRAVSFFFARIFPLVFVLAGAAVMSFGIRDLLRARASTGWPVAEGIIRSSVVESHSGNKGGTTYSAKVTYEYSVPSGKLTGDKVGFGDYGSSDSAHAYSVVNRYDPGKPVRVSYSPEDPALAVLEPGIQGATWFLPGFGLAFFAAGAAMAVFLPRAMRKQAELHRQKARSAAAGDSLAGPGVPESHPKVSVVKGIDATVFETRAAKKVGPMLIVIAVIQIVFVTTIFSKQSGAAFPLLIFIVADAVMFALGMALLFSKFTVTVTAGKVGMCLGVAGKGYRKEIARLSPMSVTLENRGAEVNNRPVDAIVVRNADGAEFHFGSFLDDSRKRFLAVRLAGLLAPKPGTPANPFE